MNRKESWRNLIDGQRESHGGIETRAGQRGLPRIGEPRACAKALFEIGSRIKFRLALQGS